MKMFGIRNKDTGRVIKEFDDFFMARQNITNPDRQEIVERISENIYQRYPDGKVYIIGVNYKWIAGEYRKDVT